MAEVAANPAEQGGLARVTKFNANEVITTALTDLMHGSETAIGYAIGHGELPFSNGGPMSVLRRSIDNRHINVREIPSSQVEQSSAGITLLFIFGAQTDFSESEVALLRDFWDKGGGILFLIDPSAKTPTLLSFLHNVGVEVDDDRLMAIVKTSTHDVARVRDVVAHFLPGSPIAKQLADTRAPFFGPTSSLTLEADRAAADNIHLVPLAQAERGYWGETDYNSGDDAILQFDPGRDKSEPLTIAASAEKDGDANRRATNKLGGIVVVANANFVRDNALSQGQESIDFINACIDWLTSRQAKGAVTP
jgi:hypothetical protein